MKNSITVLEFEKISVNTFTAHGISESLAKTAFNELEKFILPADNSENITDEENFNEYGELKDASACMSIGTENGKKVIRVKSYVGTIALKCGVTIEVLPKITTVAAKESAVSAARKLVIEMLKACSDVFYKSFQNANLSIEKLNLFEVFIFLFLTELGKLYKKGLKAGYVTYEGNENFLKGKLLLNNHIKHNFSHKEKFYVEYDEFSFNRAENRLVKTTIAYLLRKSQDDKNKRELRQYFLLFDEISCSENVEADFAKCECGRSVKDYEQIIRFCRVFLRKKSFSVYSGKNDAIALMFPMEVLFEKYIAKEMGKCLHSDWQLFAQQPREYLFDEKFFSLRPDIILENKSNKIIVDTKWKRLCSDPKKNYGISQADMYQMYAYNTRLPGAKEVVLLYPYCEDVKNLVDIQYTVSSLGVKIYIGFFDLIKYQNQKRCSFKNCVCGLNSNSNLLNSLS